MSDILFTLRLYFIYGLNIFLSSIKMSLRKTRRIKGGDEGSWNSGAGAAMNYSAPAMNYSAPAMNYSAPAMNYSAPAAEPVMNWSQVAPAPAMNYVQPAMNYVQPAPAINYVQPAPAMNYVQPAPAINYVQPAPAMNYVQPAPAMNYVQAAPAMNYVQAAPAMNYVQAAPAMNYVQPAPVINGAAVPVPVINAPANAAPAAVNTGPAVNAGNKGANTPPGVIVPNPSPKYNNNKPSYAAPVQPSQAAQPVQPAEPAQPVQPAQPIVRDDYRPGYVSTHGHYHSHNPYGYGYGSGYNPYYSSFGYHPFSYPTFGFGGFGLGLGLGLGAGYLYGQPYQAPVVVPQQHAGIVAANPGIAMIQPAVHQQVVQQAQAVQAIPQAQAVQAIPQAQAVQAIPQAQAPVKPVPQVAKPVQAIAQKPPPPDHYAKLGVVRTASQNTIDTAYKTLKGALNKKPNKNTAAAINAAYKVLSDKQARKNYNSSVNTWLKTNMPAPSKTASTAPPPDHYAKLGVIRSANQGALNSAYKTLKNALNKKPNNATAKAVNAAYKVLSNSQTRKNYNTSVNYWVKTHPPPKA
jgi:hypothetical protein